jgi:hypothetical protein
VTDGGTAQICADYQNTVQASIAKADAGSLAETFTGGSVAGDLVMTLNR